MLVNPSPPRPHFPLSLFNPSPSRPHFPQAARPLPALQSNVLAASESNSQIQWPDSPQSVYRSPLQKHFQDVLDSSPLSASSSGVDRRPVSPSRVGRRPLSPSPHRPTSPSPLRPATNTPFVRAKDQPIPHEQSLHRGLGHGIDLIGAHADLVPPSSNANARTRGAFKPQRAQKGTNSWQLKQFAEATLGSGSLRKVVKLPEGEDKDEWLAVNGTVTRPPLIPKRQC